MTKFYKIDEVIHRVKSTQEMGALKRASSYVDDTSELIDIINQLSANNATDRQYVEELGELRLFKQRFELFCATYANIGRPPMA